MPVPSHPVQFALRQAYRAQQAGDIAAAERGYRQALALVPDEPDALQLLGLLHKRRGELDAAEACWRRSLAARAKQPHVLNNLANLLARTGRAHEAEQCLLQAIAWQPAYADAHYNLARLLHARSDARGAMAALAQALSHAPVPTAGMRQLQALLLTDAARLDEALQVLEAALEQTPGVATLHHNRAVLLHRLGRNAESLQAHEQARQLGADDADAHYNRGNTLQELGRADDALAAYGVALAREPAHALALYDLARLRWRLADPQPYAELLAAQRANPDHATAFAIHAHLLWRAQDHAQAASCFERAIACDPAVPAHHDGLGRCLVRLGQIEAGLAAHRLAIELAPADPDLRVNFCASLLVAGDVGAALQQAQTARELAPDDQHALALLGLCWRALGDAREAWLNDEQRLVGVADLAPPAGWSSMADFLQALARELDGLHCDRQAPVDQSLRGGTQSVGTLFKQAHPRVDELKAVLARAVDEYLAALPVDPEHPFLCRRSAGWRFTDSWSSRLAGQGHHVDHVHPHGWVSGVVYIRLPRACADAERRSGWLRFGQPDLDLSRLGLSSAARRVECPRPGRVVLFPSMMWHGTIPFDGHDDRLTIAFDLVPRP
jgi:uncharacterized protein (TIGR02466 family)